MAEDVLKNIVGIFDLGKIKSPKLKTERTSSYIFTVYLVVEIFTLFSEVNLPMRVSRYKIIQSRINYMYFSAFRRIIH